MSSFLASLICAVGIAGLFWLDRDNSVRTSKALWIPVLWLGIVGSRPVSTWMGFESTSGGYDQLLDGSPIDRYIYELLLAAAIVVLLHRASRTSAILRVNGAILLYFLYCLLSVSWSDYPDVSFKRWIKAIGDLAMILIVLTDAQPTAALQRFLSRVGFVLLPMSVLFIKYFESGRGYDPAGMPMNTGVTTNKNTLGVITLVIALGKLWRVLQLLKDKGYPDRGRHLLAQGTLLAFGVAVLVLAHSATSLVCFALGSLLMVVTNLRSVQRRPAGVHVVVLTIFLAAGIAKLTGADAMVVQGLGRQTNFTGRTEIWSAVLTVPHNPIIGVGFETFWLGPRLDEVWSHLSEYMHVNEAHNGYLEMYLNLGWIGVGLIAVLLITGYLGAVTLFRRDPLVGSLALAYIAASAVYSVTEAGFRMLLPIWMFLLLAVSAARAGVLHDRQFPLRIDQPDEAVRKLKLTRASRAGQPAKIA